MYSMMDGFPPKSKRQMAMENRVGGGRYKQKQNEMPQDGHQQQGHSVSHLRQGYLQQNQQHHRRLSVTENFPFPEFVLKPGLRKNHTSMHPGHYDRQEHFLFSNHSCPSFDFLGRVEHFDEDMRTILYHLNATKMIDYFEAQGGKIIPSNTWGSNKKKSIGGDLRSVYSLPEVVNRVASVYKKDFDLLGYDSREVPPT